MTDEPTADHRTDVPSGSSGATSAAGSDGPDPLADVRRAARDSLYVGVGLGLLAFQALQVRRRELERELGVGVPPSPADVRRLLERLADPG